MFSIEELFNGRRIFEVIESMFSFTNLGCNRGQLVVNEIEENQRNI